MAKSKVVTCKPLEVAVGRDTSWRGTPCSGYATFYSPSPDGTGGIRERHVSDFVEEAIGIPEPGSVVRLTVTVELVKAAKASRKLCHNPFHRHPSEHSAEHPDRIRHEAEMKRAARKAAKGTP